MLRRLTDEALSTYFTVPERTFFERGLQYPVSKLYNDFMTGNTTSAQKKTDWAQWDEISDGLYLGKLPLKDDCDTLINFVNDTQTKGVIKPLGLIVSVVDYFELGGAFPLPAIATPKDWAQRKVKHCMLPIQDFGATAHDECIIHTLYEMHKCALDNISIYVHCKAGRGRSAMLYAIYLSVFDIRFANLPPEQAFDAALTMMKTNRNQVKLDQIKTDKAMHVIEVVRGMQDKYIVYANDETVPHYSYHMAQQLMHKTLLMSDITSTSRLFSRVNLKQKIDDYLASNLGKKAISELVSFKELAIYAAYNEPYKAQDARVEAIRSLFAKILFAEDGRWFFCNKFDQSINQIETVEQLSWFYNVVSDDAAIRKQMVEDFIKEVSAHICATFSCTPVALTAISEQQCQLAVAAAEKAKAEEVAKASSLVPALCAK